MWIRVFCLTSNLLLFFFGRKNMLKKKAVSRTSYPASEHLYTCVLGRHIRIHICRNFVHLDYSGPQSVSSPATPGLTFEGPICSVCVCVCVHIYTHIHPHMLPPPLKDREKTDKTVIFPHVKNNVPRQQQVLCMSGWPPSPSYLNDTMMNKMCIHEHTCTCQAIYNIYDIW